MKSKITFIVLSVVFIALHARAQLNVGVETGAVFTGYNNVRIPATGGTEFSLSNDLDGNPFFFYRLSATYTFKSRHNLSLLFAPLQTQYKGSVDRDIFFVNTLFPANTNLVATYKFNSYRLTYRYDFVKRPKFEFGMGLTAKIRDAEIELNSADASDESSNVGFVPIVNFRLMWRYNNKLGLLLQGDAFAVRQGRAEDVLLAGVYNPSDKWQLYLGYRILEGGSDGKTVYTFSEFNYAAIGATYTLFGK